MEDGETPCFNQHEFMKRILHTAKRFGLRFLFLEPSLLKYQKQ